jgi:hypothetical protein
MAVREGEEDGGLGNEVLLTAGVCNGAGAGVSVGAGFAIRRGVSLTPQQGFMVLTNPHVDAALES